MKRKIPGRRCAEADFTACAGVSNGQLPGVKQLARKIRAAPIGPVSRNGMAEVFQMHADLVGPPGFRPALQEGEIAFRK